MRKSILFLQTMLSVGSSSKSNMKVSSCEVHWSNMPCQTRSDAEAECYKYLYDNLMVYDEVNAGSLGFPSIYRNGDRNSINASDEDDVTRELAAVETDGLEYGIVQPTVNLSLNTKEYPWNEHVPKEIFMEYVLNFANVNEARNNWRQLLTDVLDPLVTSLVEIDGGKDLTVEEVVMALNSFLWDAFDSDNPIRFESGQTPLIFDAMSVISFGYASCTGLSILFVDALRALGIPARIAGTPAWNGDPENGNHTWLEVYTEDLGWRITESAPAAGSVNSLSDPSEYWFCNSEKFDGNTKVYAARLDKSLSGETYFPLAWDVNNHGVPGEDVSERMTNICS